MKHAELPPPPPNSRAGILQHARLGEYTPIEILRLLGPELVRRGQTEFRITREAIEDQIWRAVNISWKEDFDTASYIITLSLDQRLYPSYTILDAEYEIIPPKALSPGSPE